MSMLSLRNSRAALVAGSIAASTFMMAGAAVTSPAYAQQVAAANITSQTDCTAPEFRTTVSGSAQCELQRNELIRIQEQNALAANACITRLQQALTGSGQNVDAVKTRVRSVLVEMNAPGLTRDNACAVARAALG